jgi:hypothetical protein
MPLDRKALVLFLEIYLRLVVVMVLLGRALLAEMVVLAVVVAITQAAQGVQVLRAKVIMVVLGLVAVTA